MSDFWPSGQNISDVHQGGPSHIPNYTASKLEIRMPERGDARTSDWKTWHEAGGE